MDPRDVLSREAEAVPDWLDANTNLTSDILKRFLMSRVVFYPGSGNDGHPFRVFGGSGAAHCFVYADYGAEPPVDGRYGRMPTGYERSISKVVSLGEIGMNLDPRHPFGQDLQDNGFLRGWYARRTGEDWVSGIQATWMVFCRHENFPETHGSKIFSLLYIHAEAVWIYWNLWARKMLAPYAVLLQDHAWGANWAKFGGQHSPLYKLTERSQKFPPWLFVGYNTESWPGYDKTSDPDPRDHDPRSGDPDQSRTLYRLNITDGATRSADADDDRCVRDYLLRWADRDID